MMDIVKSVVAVGDKAVKFPVWDDRESVTAYLQGMCPHVADVIVTIVQSVEAGRLGIIGDAPLDMRVKDELEMSGVVGVNPIVIQVIVMVIMKVIEKLIEAKK